MDLSKAGKAQRTQTALHNKMREIIQAAGFHYVEEYLVMGPNRANYSLDFYLPEFHVGIEADGPQHKPNVDRMRDDWIIRTTGIVVKRFTTSEIYYDKECINRLVEFCDSQFYSIVNRKAMAYS